MRLQPRTITLGEHRWTVRPLTCAQVQAIEPLLFADGGAHGTVAAALAVLRVALARDHAEAVAQIDEIEAGAPEIAAALADVLRLGGFVPDEETMPPGELVAGTAPAPIGALSTPA